MLRTVALSALAFSILSAAPASADVLFTTSVVGASPRSSDYAVGEGGYRTFDNFTVQTDANVTTISWSGFWFGDPTPEPAPAPDVTSWELAFFADVAGTPGGLIASQTLASADVSWNLLGTGVFSVGTTYNVRVYTLSALLPVPFTAVAGQTYWLSILAHSPSFEPIFAWRAADGGIGDASWQQQLNASGSVVSNGAVARDRHFTLEGTPVPEPASLLLLGAAAVGFAATRRRL